MPLDSQLIKDKFRVSTIVNYTNDAQIHCEYKVDTEKEFKELVSAFTNKETAYVNYFNEAYKVTICADVPYIVKYITL